MRSRSEGEFGNGDGLSTGKAFSIASVTVVYNGVEVLQRHLESLKGQSRQLDEIVIIDNASTDGTRDLLASKYPEVTVIELSSNSGVGGGLAAGLSYAALQQRHDWIWLFDQDSVPAPDCLERLLSGFQQIGGKGQNIGVLAPTCVNRETGMTYPGLSWHGQHFAPAREATDQPVTFVDMVITSGSLMRLEAIEAAGLPRADFFMDFVDYEHCLRIRRHGFQVAVIRDSILDHSIGAPTTFNILGRTKPWADHVPWREYYMARNETFTMWEYSPKLATTSFVLYRLVQHALGIVFFGKQKWCCLRMMWRGFFDGRQRRLGLRVLPGKSTDSTVRQPQIQARKLKREF
jgi:GT2 family glycosyltransferase